MFALMPHKYAVDELVSRFESNPDKKVFRIFIDLRNAIVVFHDEANLQTSIKDPELMISEIMTDILNFMNYVYELIPYEVEYHFFWEVGRSEYHKKLNKLYKSKRGNSYLVLKSEEINSAKNINIIAFQAWEILSKYIANVKAYKLNYFEADFIPNYIIHKMANDNKYYNVIFSNDKDMYQIVDGVNTVQIKKSYGKEITPNGEVLKIRITMIIDEVTKYTDLLKKESDEVMPKVFGKCLIANILALAGDTADEIEGIAGMGYNSAFIAITTTGLIVEDLYEKYESYDVWFEELMSTVPEPTGRKRKKHPPYTPGILKNIAKVFEHKDMILNNLKQIDFNIIQDEMPMKQKDEVQAETDRITTTEYDDLKMELKELRIDIHSLKFIEQPKSTQTRSDVTQEADIRVISRVENMKHDSKVGFGAIDKPTNAFNILGRMKNN